MQLTIPSPLTGEGKGGGEKWVGEALASLF
jgi:hypothetical protein